MPGVIELLRGYEKYGVPVRYQRARRRLQRTALFRQAL